MTTRFVKCIEVINSCETLQQLNMAHNFCVLASKNMVYESYIFIYRIYIEKYKALVAQLESEQAASIRFVGGSSPSEGAI